MIFPGIDHLRRRARRLRRAAPSSPRTTSTPSAARCRRVAYVSASNRTVAQVIYGNQNWSTSDPGRARSTGRSSARGTSPGAVLHRPGRPRGGQGLRPRPDGRRRTSSAARTRSARPSASRTCPFKVVGVLERKGGSTDGPGPGRHRRRALRDGAQEAPRHDRGRRHPRLGALERAGRRARRTRSPASCGSGTGSTRPGQDDDFIIRSQTEMLQQAERSSRGR